jgi:8-oxo-dGTP pyrophosphatase MutT (NUDIX family)
MTKVTPTLRRAARVLMLDEDRRVLLVRLAYRGQRWWVAPGGGLEEDENHEETARREAAEETGFELDELGSWVWTREDVFRFEGRIYHQRERYFLANVPAFDPCPRVIDAEEAKTFDGLRWWVTYSPPGNQGGNHEEDGKRTHPLRARPRGALRGTSSRRSLGSGRRWS